jgi:hypothetical protein
MRDIHRARGAASPSEKRFRPMDETKAATLQKVAAFIEAFTAANA